MEKDEKDAISELVKYQIQKTRNHVKATVPSAVEKPAIEEAVHRYREERKAKIGEEEAEVFFTLNSESWRNSQKNLFVDQQRMIIYT